MNTATFWKRIVVAMVAITILLPLATQAQSLRKVLIEEATNASCGPCASQNPQFHLWMDKHKDVLVPLIYHWNFPGPNDPMYLVTPTMQQGRISQYYGISGVPSSQLNGKMGTPSGGWYEGAPGDTACLTSLLSNQPGYSPITIKIEMTEAGAKGSVKVDVSSIAAFSGKKLRIAICEEEHYYANAGNNGEKTFHYLMRTMLPDHNGVDISLSAGETKSFTQEFTVAPANATGGLYAIAFVQDDASKEVMQVETTREMPSRTPPQFALFNGQFQTQFAKPTASSADLSLIMMNNGTEDATFTFDFNVSARTPVDWTASILGDKTSVVVPAGMAKDVTLQLIPGPTLGVGDVSASVSVKSGTKTSTFTSDVLTVVSENITTLHILDGEDANSLSPIILSAKGKTAYPEVNSNLFANISSQLKSLKTIVWDCSATGEIGTAEAKSIASAMDNGVGVLLCGGATTQGIVTEGLISKFGAGFVAFCREGYGSAPYAVKLSGVAGDPISGSFGTNVTGNLISYLLPLYKVTSPNAKPILAFAKSADSVCGVRIELTNSRAVLLGMNPFVILDKTKRETLIKNAINWIEGAGEKKPTIANISSVKFDKVDKDKTKEMQVEIMNSGDADLVITKMEIEGDNVFNIKSVSLPLTVKPGEKINITVSFAPTEIKGYTGTLKIYSNNNNQTTDPLSVALSGEGKDPLGVFTPAEEAHTILSLISIPNPSVDKSTLSYTVGGASPLFVEIYMINSLGQRVLELGSKMYSPGNHSITINATTLANGSYRIIARTSIETVQLPIVVSH